MPRAIPQLRARSRPRRAQQLLTANGWKVVPGGTTTCVKPGTGAGECGAGISKGEGISFNLDYAVGRRRAAERDERPRRATPRRSASTINLTTHPFDDGRSRRGAPCTPTQATCKWTAENWGAGWIYGPDYLPDRRAAVRPGLGRELPVATATRRRPALIPADDHRPQPVESAGAGAYAKYVGQQVPVIFGPTSIGTYAGDAGDARRQQARRLRGQRAGPHEPRGLVLHQVAGRIADLSVDRSDPA